MPITINYRDTLEFAPVFNIQGSQEAISIGSQTPFTHRSLTGVSYIPLTSVQVYDISGINLENTTKTSEPANSVNFSSFPVIRAASGFTQSAKIIFSGNRATSKSNLLSFAPYVPAPYTDGPITLINGTYAKYSINRVIAISDALPNSKFLTVVNGVIVRQHLAEFSHQNITGTCVSSGNLSALQGYRPSAITKRHVVHCGHYGALPIGRKLYFLPADNGPLVERTIVGGINFEKLTDLDTLPIPAGAGYAEWDFEMGILDSDLPDSIKPYPIASPYLSSIISTSSSEIAYCSQGAAFTLYNNDGDFVPFLQKNLFNSTITQSIVSKGANTFGLEFDGLPLIRSTCAIPNGQTFVIDGFTQVGRPDIINTIGSKFYHNVREGDSGSPILIPVGADEFALSGFISTNANPLPATYNSLIQRVDARAVAAGQIPAVTGYTVRVATAPTL
jgi:hypothetical protein